MARAIDKQNYVGWEKCQEARISKVQPIMSTAQSWKKF